MAQIIDLPPSQKDVLYSAFAEKARDRTFTFHPGELKPQFAYAFQEGPRIDDPLALALGYLLFLASWFPHSLIVMRASQREMGRSVSSIVPNRGCRRLWTAVKITALAGNFREKEALP